MFIKLFRYCYNNFKANLKILIGLIVVLLFCICILPWFWAFKWFYDIRVFFATVNVRIHFIGRHPKIIRTRFVSSPFYSPVSTAICFIVATNKELQSARQNGFEGELIEVTKKMLARYRYPKLVIPEVNIGLVSMEKINAAGGYFQYFS
jgi:hypothetical protein